VIKRAPGGLALLMLGLILLTAQAGAQTPLGSVVSRPAHSPFDPPWASSVAPADSSGQNAAATPADAESGDERTVSWKRLIPNILEDQKGIWLFPKNWFEGKDLLPTGAFVVGTGGLVVLDPYTAPYFRRTSSFSEFNKIVSSKNAVIGMAAVPLSAYAVGLIRRDSYMQQTALLAGEAVVDSELLTQVLKGSTRRLLPEYIPPYGKFRATWFRNHTGPWYTAPGSFPSGHMIAAVSIATIFARRYGRKHRWVPWAAYGLAGVVGFSRLTLSAHFPSDVFAAAFLGYAISRYDVLRGQ
jgi:membrane-associated phospholipid phosphatase